MTHRVVLAPNPGPMTLDGTNTWVLGDHRSGRWVVVDPGPADETHLRTVLAECRGSIQEIVLSHHHADHSAGVARLAELADCPVRAAAPQFRSGGAGLVDGQVITVGDVGLVALATPGHTADSFSFLLVEDGVVRLLSGDTVLGRGTTVIAEPDGHLGAYLSTLDRLVQVVRDRDVVQILPGHGPVIDDPLARLEAYRRHRMERLEQVRAALVAGARTAAQVVDVVYAGIDPAVRPAAEQSVRAQLKHLESGDA